MAYLDYLATFTIDINQMQVNIPYKDPFRSISCMLTFPFWAAMEPAVRSRFLKTVAQKVGSCTHDMKLCVDLAEILLDKPSQHQI